MKKTCNGCRAMEASGGGCSLGYITEAASSMWDIELEHQPLEDCPKPITDEKFYEELEKSGRG
ncbi:hypothetical protein ABKP09_20030 [Peribacillus frigoritolerans]|uniref:hypothetical protein n=1 Tax=Peribacillus frigoritolerans TaxID=450367 RepID=UPI0032B311A7